MIIKTFPKEQQAQGIEPLNVIEFFLKANQQVYVKLQHGFIW